MDLSLLLILLCCFLLAPPCRGCETGVAHVQSVLSVPNSLMANADVAYLKSFNASGVEQCMKDCCTGVYGHCTVASFKKNTTEKNCMHFYCEPLTKCKFLSSDFTDSFSFSSSTFAKTTTTVPSPPHSSSSSSAPETSSTLHDNTSSTPLEQTSSTKEEVATYSEEQFPLKSDNTSVKPRKGVALPELPPPRSGVKPRKGVSLEDAWITLQNESSPSSFRSNVKPRKGVEPYPAVIAPSAASSVVGSPAVSTSLQGSASDNVTSEDVIEALKRVFEDDVGVVVDAAVTSSSLAIAPTPSSTTPVTTTTSSHSAHGIQSSPHVTSSHTLVPSSGSFPDAPVSQSTPTLVVSTTSSSSTADGSSGRFTTSTIVSSSTTYFLTVLRTDRPPVEVRPETRPSTEKPRVEVGTETPHETVKSRIEVDPDSLLRKVNPGTLLIKDKPRVEVDPERTHEVPDPGTFHANAYNALPTSDEEKKYKSSIHLVISLVFGLLVLVAVLGVIAKRVYDGWLRRDYYRMNYLIDGIYNGVE